MFILYYILGPVRIRRRRTSDQWLPSADTSDKTLEDLPPDVLSRLRECTVIGDSRNRLVIPPHGHKNNPFNLFVSGKTG